MERMEKNGVEVLPKNVVAAHLSSDGLISWFDGLASLLGFSNVALVG